MLRGEVAAVITLLRQDCSRGDDAKMTTANIGIAMMTGRGDVAGVDGGAVSARCNTMGRSEYGPRMADRQVLSIGGPGPSVGGGDGRGVNVGEPAAQGYAVKQAEGEGCRGGGCRGEAQGGCYTPRYTETGADGCSAERLNEWVGGEGAG